MRSSKEPSTPPKKARVVRILPREPEEEEKNTKERMCVFNKVLQDEFLLLV